MLKKKHLVGIAVSMALFGVFGLMVGGIVSVYGGVAYEAPIDALATGPTALPIADVTTPFSFTPDAVGLPADAAVVLPGVPVAVTALGFTVSVSGLTVATVFGGGGIIAGFLVGLYYAIDIALEQRQNAQVDDDSSSAPTE